MVEGGWLLGSTIAPWAFLFRAFGAFFFTSGTLGFPSICFASRVSLTLSFLVWASCLLLTGFSLLVLCALEEKPSVFSLTSYV